MLFENGRAVGVIFYYKGQQFTAKARKAVILSAGAFVTPMILQQSGIGFQKDLLASGILKPGQKPFLSLPTGRYLYDHLALYMWIKFSGSAQSLLELLSSVGGYYAPIRFGQFAAPCIGFFSIPLSNGVPIIETYFFMLEVGSLNLAPLITRIKFRPSIIQYLLHLNKKYVLVVVVPSLLTPKSYGNVRVGVPGPDFIKNPYIFFNYMSDSEDYDRKALVQAMALIQSFEKSPTWAASNAKFVRLPLPECAKFTNVYTNEYRICYLTAMTETIFHPTSTARMGNDTATSVCTARCNVHGIPNLYVIDASS